MTYKAIGRPIVNYVAPVWVTNISKMSLDKIQVAQNESLRIATRSNLMSFIDHITH